MLFEIMLSAALAGPGPTGAGINPGEETLQAVRELYTYATQSVQVEPDEVQRMVAEIQQRMGEAPDGSANALESLVSAAEQPEPDGREIRVLARDLYATLVTDQA